MQGLESENSPFKEIRSGGMYGARDWSLPPPVEPKPTAARTHSELAANDKTPLLAERGEAAIREGIT